MSIYIKYLNSDASFSDQFTGCLTDIIERLLEEYNLSGGEVAVVIADNVLLKGLNRQYRNTDTPTDVLSFSYLESADQPPREEKEFAVGDIYISVERASDQAKEAGHSLRQETALLVVHGMLHLLGFDHREENGAKVMREKERAVMSEYDHVISGGEMNA